jgi:hypothetical protein
MKAQATCGDGGVWPGVTVINRITEYFRDIATLLDAEVAGGIVCVGIEVEKAFRL